MHVVCKPLLQKARGTQQSIIGFNTVKACAPDELGRHSPRLLQHGEERKA